jgi:hypothetical protein
VSVMTATDSWAVKVRTLHVELCNAFSTFSAGRMSAIEAERMAIEAERMAMQPS